MKIFGKINNTLLYPGAYLYFTIQSYLNWLKSLFKKDNILLESPYEGQKILLLALYEKGSLRKDIINLLEVAKKQHVYVICVNTLKLNSIERYSELMDCYIERCNYGRDFGSYKSGFMYFYKKHLHEKCPRLLVLNDSLFYSKKNQASFIEALLKTDIEVLGATENHEIEYHLGSFCLSIDGVVLRNKKFLKYWKKYKNSDVRPTVIRRGEMGLSKTLRSCVSSPDNFSALYDLAWFSECINNNQEIINSISDFSRTSDLVEWNIPSLKSGVDRLLEKYIIKDVGLAENDVKIKTENKQDALVYFADTPALIAKAIQESTNSQESTTIKARVFDEVKNDMIDCFPLGSQIHQNGILLHHLGMPIIKLDALFRGMYSTEDIEKLAQQLEPDEVMQFKRLLYSKPFGGAVLFGWKRAAFYRGLI